MLVTKEIHQVSQLPEWKKLTQALSEPGYV